VEVLFPIFEVTLENMALAYDWVVYLLR